MKKTLFLFMSIVVFSCESDDSNSSSSGFSNSDGSSSTQITAAQCENTNATLLNLDEAEKEILLTQNDMDITRNVLEEVNRYRASQNLELLESNENLLLLGIQHNQYQIENDDISHDNAISRFCSLASVSKVVAFAENTAFGFNKAEDVVKALLESTNHKQNIEGNFDAMSTSVVANEDGVLFYTQIFVRF